MRQTYLVAFLVLCGLLAAPLVSSDPGTATAQSAGDSCLDPRSDIALQNGVSVPRSEANVSVVA